MEDVEKKPYFLHQLVGHFLPAIQKKVDTLPIAKEIRGSVKHTSKIKLNR